jgi:hypothetical protein
MKRTRIGESRRQVSTAAPLRGLSVAVAGLILALEGFPWPALASPSIKPGHVITAAVAIEKIRRGELLGFHSPEDRASADRVRDQVRRSPGPTS